MIAPGLHCETPVASAAGDAAILALHKAWLACEDGLNNASPGRTNPNIEPGGPEERAFDRLVSCVSRKQNAMLKDMAAARATTPAGVVAKLELFLRYYDDGGTPEEIEVALLRSAIGDLRAMRPDPDTKLVELWAEHERIIAEVDGRGAPQAEVDAVADRTFEIWQEIVATPARGPAGIAVKLCLIRNWHENGDPAGALDTRLFDGMARDLCAMGRANA